MPRSFSAEGHEGYYRSPGSSTPETPTPTPAPEATSVPDQTDKEKAESTGVPVTGVTSIGADGKVSEATHGTAVDGSEVTNPNVGNEGGQSIANPRSSGTDSSAYDESMADSNPALSESQKMFQSLLDQQSGDFDKQRNELRQDRAYEKNRMGNVAGRMGGGLGAGFTAGQRQADIGSEKNMSAMMLDQGDRQRQLQLSMLDNQINEANKLEGREYAEGQQDKQHKQQQADQFNKNFMDVVMDPNMTDEDIQLFLETARASGQEMTEEQESMLENMGLTPEETEAEKHQAKADALAAASQHNSWLDGNSKRNKSKNYEEAKAQFEKDFPQDAKMQLFWDLPMEKRNFFFNLNNHGEGGTSPEWGKALNDIASEWEYYGPILEKAGYTKQQIKDWASSGSELRDYT